MQSFTLWLLCFTMGLAPLQDPKAICTSWGAAAVCSTVGVGRLPALCSLPISSSIAQHFELGYRRPPAGWIA